MNQKQNDRKDVHDSTTEFFLKVVQKEKNKKEKENAPIENLSSTTMKTIDTFGRFYNYLNQLLDRILSSRVTIMLLSFVIAAVLFYNITGQDIIASPTSGVTIEDVTIQVEGLDDSLEITSDIPSSVTVGLIGSSLDIYSTTLLANYEVYIDLSGYEEGSYTVDLKSRNFNDDLTVMLVPNSFDITLEEKVTQDFNLTYTFINEDQLDSKYSVNVESISLDTVTVYASETTLAKIAKVAVCIDVADKSEAFDQTCTIKAFDSNNEALDVAISPSTADVTCSVASYSKTVPLEINFTGEVASGYQIADYTMSQSEVTIYGLQENIDEIDSIVVNVDVSNLNSSTTFENIALNKESGINKFSTDTVTVSVEIEKVVSKKLDNIEITVLNNSEDYKVSFVGESDTATVSLTGSEDKIDAISADNVTATIDIDGLSTGTHQVEVSAMVDDDKVTIELLSSSTVTITIERN
ncbi:MAG: hypothetical protein LUG12_05570 [Erysipelotrichaceae bacterium]|nr:hypothetical protein [Erysipelotrichaceae bacterium]